MVHFNPMVVRLKSDLVNTKEGTLSLCDKLNHTNTKKYKKLEEAKVLWTAAL